MNDNEKSTSWAVWVLKLIILAVPTVLPVIVVGVTLLHVGFVQMAWAGQSMLLSKKNVVSRVLEFFE